MMHFTMRQVWVLETDCGNDVFQSRMFFASEESAREALAKCRATAEVEELEWLANKELEKKLEGLVNEVSPAA